MNQCVSPPSDILYIAGNENQKKYVSAEKIAKAFQEGIPIKLENVIVEGDLELHGDQAKPLDIWRSELKSLSIKNGNLVNGFRLNEVIIKENILLRHTKINRPFLIKKLNLVGNLGIYESKLPDT